jgi:hypothetical protein
LPPPDPPAALMEFSIDQFVGEALVISFTMVVHHEFGERTTEVSLAKRDQAVQDSSLIERTNRSACALQLGARKRVWMTRPPDASSRRRTSALHFRSRSQIRIRRSRARRRSQP